MAGIGFALRELLRKDDLKSAAAGYGYAAIASSGPWILTVAAIALMSLAAERDAGAQSLNLVRSVIIYNFCFGLVFSSPVAAFATRYLSDRIYALDASTAPTALLQALGLALALQAPIVIGFYGFFAVLDPAMRLAALMNYALTAAIWVIAVFLTALKDYKPIGYAFAFGMVLAVALAAILAPFGPAAILTGFTAGLAVLLAIMGARVFAEYPAPLAERTGFADSFGRFRDIAFAAFAYNAGIWSDKWVMWFAPEADWPATRLITYPIYDGAMFLAQLTLVPGLALFIIAIETRFYETYARYYAAIRGHAGLDEILLRHREIKAALAGSVRNLAVLQGGVAVVALLVSPLLTALPGFLAAQAGIFRFGVLGAFFHGFVLFALVVLSYFELRRDAVVVSVLFLVLNAGASALTLWLGFAWYGYGYFVAALVTAAFAGAICTMRLRKLPFLTFVGNNPAVRGR